MLLLVNHNNSSIWLAWYLDRYLDNMFIQEMYHYLLSNKHPHGVCLWNSLTHVIGKYTVASPLLDCLALFLQWLMVWICMFTKVELDLKFYLLTATWLTVDDGIWQHLKSHSQFWTITQVNLNLGNLLLRLGGHSTLNLQMGQSILADITRSARLLVSITVHTC